ncbi:MAG: bifunctional [glutamine synthetase] adenylyltransferase/[glutamine synthetase]-adenylyl-L-tyrosine phosphorylase [Pseudomonadota bacterium]
MAGHGFLPPRPGPIGDAVLRELPSHDGWLDAETLSGVFEGSPFLRRVVESDPDCFLRTVSAAPEAVTESTLSKLDAAVEELVGDEKPVMRALRTAKKETALAIAFADLSGIWTVDEVTEALTALADHTLSIAHRSAIVINGGLPSEADKGIVYLAMGKYGACELNFSSDIDLIAIFDPSTFPVHSNRDPAMQAVKIVQKTASIMQTVTADGYVFRVDLRLRPNPSGTGAAVALPAALAYYEASGQNWERAALIKARACVGDLALADEFLHALQPFVWRRSLDYASIADIHAMKRQIHAVKGHGAIATAGHNVKLGRGGIREIEFFAQTQQLIAGGRTPALREKKTKSALAALERLGWIEADVCLALSDAYDRLRALEHRIQMVGDQQTHTLPGEKEEFGQFSRFCGFERVDAFEKSLRATFSTVQSHYETLFEAEPSLGTGCGALVFTGVEPDPETVETLNGMGFGDPRSVWTTIARWHHGTIPAMRTARARERLTELTPRMLETISKLGDADAAFVNFSRFVEALPAGLQFFSLLHSNPKFLDLLMLILGTAPRLAERLVRRPSLFDALIDPRFFGELPTPVAMREAIDAAFSAETTYEGVLDAARTVVQDQQFLIGVRQLTRLLPAEGAARAYSALAEAAISALLPEVQRAFAEIHGEIAGGAVAILAMGKLGSSELTASSDLDLILIYTHADDAPVSDGSRPVAPSQYFIRLTQRFIAALSAQTSRGRLYEVDMRLRPSGRSGPVAVPLSGFLSYQQEKAWVWEHMALTRAHVICGDAGLKAEIETGIRDVVTHYVENGAIMPAAFDMRERIAREKPARNAFDVKLIRGGLLDIEFIVQALTLHHRVADVLGLPMDRALDTLKDSGILKGDAHAVLAEGYAFQSALSQALRLCVEGNFDPDVASKGLRSLLAETVALPDFETLSATLNDTQHRVETTFHEIFAVPSNGAAKSGAGPTTKGET